MVKLALLDSSGAGASSDMAFVYRNRVLVTLRAVEYLWLVSGLALRQCEVRHNINMAVQSSHETIVLV